MTIQPNRLHIHAQRGFTLVELMVTLVVMGVMVALAVPAFTSQLRGWQRDSATKAFTTHIQLARSEAIKTSRRVVMCSSTDGTTCASSDEWRTGWIVFIDANANSSAETSETVLASRGTFTGLASMRATGSVQRLAFLPNGLMASTFTTVRVIPSGGNAFRMNEVTVNRTGRAYVTTRDQEA